MKIGIEGFTFDSAHYTSGISEKCSNIHGHTFEADVEIDGGEIDEESGMVLDFGILKNTVRDILKDWDHKLLIPEHKAKEIKTEGPFDLELKTIKGKAATTENIARGIAREIYKELNLPVEVKVYEGKKSYAIGRWPE
ncbi:hypothetical protein AKJ38_02170 [candidate division MSBL1 archaeon SCGC-AAA259I14]|uniref:6-pyruvoyl tetrahydropterin synthase n=2 Tax=candidate division MSBL1 TaxID=215777 RepID=A0A133US87_9EURY|nr:hypothetical protein AKJ61_03200 [candidate division MSBL1 archaeon SCGC-AAA259B11]KXA96990.1 hypothetical protein AKJ38_02170 [candidate division MSBL1 archaeon SCGC-AAA259I14]